MKITDYIKMSFKLIFRDKSNIFNGLIILISTLFLLSIFIFRENFESYINQNVNSNYGFRTLNVSAKDDIDDLGVSQIKKVENVEEVYSSQYNSVTVLSNYKSDIYDGYINLLYGGFDLNNYFNGEKEFTKGKNQLICPMNFYPDSNSFTLNINNKNMINGNDIIGKEIIINFTRPVFGVNGELIDHEFFEEKFEVIGTYDNKRVMTSNNQCYTSYDSIKKIVDEKNGPIQQGVYYSLYVKVNNLEHVEGVKKDLENLGFTNISVVNVLDNSLIENINKSLTIIQSIIILSQIILLILIMKKKIMKDAPIIGLFHNFGYRKKIIKKLYLCISIISILLSLLLGILLSFVIFILLKNTILLPFSYIGYECFYNYNNILYTFIIIFSINFLGTIMYTEIYLRRRLINIIR